MLLAAFGNVYGNVAGGYGTVARPPTSPGLSPTYEPLIKNVRTTKEVICEKGDIGAVRAPAEFVVTRHLISHPDDGPSELARHVGLHTATASRVLKRLQAAGIETDEQRLSHLRKLSERPHHKTIGFRVPNPEQFFAALDTLGAGFLVSGEAAAVRDGIDLIPERHLIYVDEGAWEAVARAADETLAKIAPSSKANLTVKQADPWLCEDKTGAYVERGQRLLDYEQSNHVQLARSLERLG